LIQVLSPRKRKKSHKQPSRGQTKFQSEYAEKFAAQTIERVKIDARFRCIACEGKENDLGRNGRKNIENHIASNKHQNNLKDYNQNRPIAQFIKTKNVPIFPFILKYKIIFRQVKKRKIWQRN
jgi:hypothetical protein